ncbi:MAG: GNAT family N-acetyltransferase [Candidatus Edwardsbacteria bacterium]|nr:GNAT family N-acetyltransferase [Candidatus Edwardsbacteria bacterium]
MNASILIRDLRADDIPHLAGFPPPEWQFDAGAFFERHLGRPYFHPLAAEADGTVVGIANSLFFGPSAWLGNIIVSPERRRRGIGAALTARLIEAGRRHGCRHQILIATELGRPVYGTQGFVRTGEYVFLKPARPVDQPDMARIRPAEPGDLGAIAALDAAATAEDRRPMLERLLDAGMVHHAGAPEHIDGFYLPAFGQGPVVADNDDAGCALLRLKHSGKDSTACIPAGNRRGIECLQDLGFVEDHRAPRMALGPDVAWDQTMIYARGAGYCG